MLQLHPQYLQTPHNLAYSGRFFGLSQIHLLWQAPMKWCHFVNWNTGNCHTKVSLIILTLWNPHAFTYQYKQDIIALLVLLFRFPWLWGNTSSGYAFCVYHITLNYGRACINTWFCLVPRVKHTIMKLNVPISCLQNSPPASQITNSSWIFY